MSKRAILYARTSGDDKKNATSSLDGQLDMCREYATGQGWPVVAELTEDERGVSGARWDAPELNRALEMAQGGQFDVLVLREMDRFARKLAKQLVIEDQFKGAGVDVIYVLEEYADSPEGRMSKNFRATVAEYEREKIRERTVRARRRSVTQGNVLVHGAGAPYGYRLVKKDGRATLVICEDEARIIRLIFEWYTVDGLSMRAIVQRLTDMRVPTPADRGKGAAIKKREKGIWALGSVSHILGNETYTGTWRYGKNNSRTTTRNPEGYHITVAIPPIISPKAWEIAQTRKVKNKAMAARNTRGDFLLRGMVKCGHCGAYVRAAAKKNTNNAYYWCGAKYRPEMYRHSCDAPYFRVDRVDAVVWNWIKAVLRNPETIRAKAEAYQAQRAEATRPLRDKLAVIDHLLAEKRQELKLAVNAYLKGGLLGEMLQEQANQLEAAITGLENDRAELVQQIEAETLTDEQIYTLEHLASLIREGGMIADEDFTERRYTVEKLRVKAELLLVDGEQYVRVSCYLGDEAMLNVSNITCYL